MCHIKGVFKNKHHPEWSKLIQKWMMILSPGPPSLNKFGKVQPLELSEMKQAIADGKASKALSQEVVICSSARNFPSSLVHMFLGTQYQEEVSPLTG